MDIKERLFAEMERRYHDPDIQDFGSYLDRTEYEGYAKAEAEIDEIDMREKRDSKLKAEGANKES